MIKDAIVRIVALAILLVCVVMINTTLTQDIARADGMELALQRSNWSGSMARFLGHANWMRLLQYRAKVSSKPDPAVAMALYNRYDTLTDQNPFMVMAYEHGGIELATMGNGELAIKLMDKGMEAADNNWKIPLYAAHVAQRYLNDDELAEKYLQKTRKISGHPTHVESQLVRVLAKKTDNDPLTKAKLWQQVTKNYMTGMHELPTPEMVGMVVPFGDPSINTKARQEVIKLLRQVRAQAQAATGQDKQDMETKAAEIEKILAGMSPSAHVCKYCFAAYNAGDKFCLQCGKPVEVFGVCSKCNAVLKPGENFCAQCGTAVPKETQTPVMLTK